MATLLIADDEQGYRDVLKVIFEDQGHSVRTVTDGRSALELLKAAPFDAVISDVRMPDMDGIEFLRAAREFYPEIGIILMTAFGRSILHVRPSNSVPMIFLQSPLTTKS